MKRRAVWTVFLLCILLTPAASQTGTWRNYTSMRSVTGVARTPATETYWASTSGGLFRWNREDGTFRQTTSADGLRSIDLTAVAVDSDGLVWMGAQTGVLHALNPASGNLLTVVDIANSSQTNKAINDLTVVGDSLLVATEFGLSVFRMHELEFGDTYRRFGSLPANVTISVLASTAFGGRLWAAITDRQTIHAVASASLSLPDLLPPQSWNVTTVGSAQTVPSSFASFNGRLYCGTSTGVYVLDQTAWSIVPGLAGAPVAAMATSATSLFVTFTDRTVLAADPAGNITTFGTALPSIPTAMATSGSGEPVVGSAGAGLLTFQGAWSSSYPNGPNANEFSNVVVDPEGVVWGASGPTNGSGMYRFDGTTWRSWTRANSALPVDEIYRVSATCDGSLWASSWGGGIVQIPREQVEFDSSEVFNTNIGMVGLANAPSYIVLSNVVCDSRGNRWMSILLAGDKNVLWIRQPDDTWTKIPAILNGRKLEKLCEGPVDKALAVDAFDNLWTVVRDEAYKGVIGFANRGTIDSIVAVHITTNDGLPSDDIKTIVVDLDNDIWVGTSRGIAIILDPSNPKRPGGIAAYRPLSGQAVNCIAVDALNQKWVGTNEGMVLLTPDGTQVLASYTVASTEGKLIDNEIRSIATDPRTGTVYAGTGYGLATLTTAAAEARPSFDGLTVYPNPYLVPSPTVLTVDGLVQNSTLKIFTSDGRMVRELGTPGGRVGFWDGKDENGQDVSSGVYLIVAYADDGKQVGTGKVAVIRK